MNNVRSQPRQAPAPSYAPSYRQTQPAAPAPNYSQSSRYAGSPSQAAPAPAKRNSWVAPAAAGVAAGALAGYALANTGSSSQPQQAPAPAPAPQYQQPAPQYQQQAPAYADQAPAPAPVYQQAAPAPAPVYQQPAPAAPAYAAAPQQSSGGFGFGSFLILVLLAAGAYFAYRRYVASKGDFKADARRTGNAAKAAGDAFKSSFNGPAASAPAATSLAKGSAAQNEQAELDRQADDLSVVAQKFYKELQVLNNNGDLVELRNRVGDDDVYNELAQAIRTRTTPSQTEVLSLHSEIVGMTKEEGRYIGSVRYEGMVQEGPGMTESFDEVFHFVKDVGVQGSWKLAGIEQVELA
jgi:predicted lipid-binding transport protein (Tim44 family)